MTIEEKARAYDEALQRARELNSGKDVCAAAGTTTCEYIFPELKESDDERIRKWLIDWVNAVNYWSKQFTLTKEQIIAWLEKQGKKPQGKSVLDVWKDMRLEVYLQASGNRHESNYSDDRTKMFSLEDIDEIIEKINEQKLL